MEKGLQNQNLVKSNVVPMFGNGTFLFCCKQCLNLLAFQKYTIKTQQTNQNNFTINKIYS